jgi:hypothetical protein
LAPFAAGGFAERAQEVGPRGQVAEQARGGRKRPAPGLAPRGRGRCCSPGPDRPGRGQERAPPFFASAWKSPGPRQAVPACWKNVSNTTRNPMLMFRLAGSFLLRYAQRAFLELLKYEPPRTTRRCIEPAPASTGSREPGIADSCDRRLAPAAEQAADLGDDLRDVPVLSVR